MAHYLLEVYQRRYQERTEDPSSNLRDIEKYNTTKYLLEVAISASCTFLSGAQNKFFELG